MNMFREQMLKNLKSADLALFEKIKDNSRPDITDLLSPSEERFIEWRKMLF